MKNYIVYSTIDGDIRVNIQCIPEDIAIQCQPNEAWMEHTPIDDSVFKVDLSTMEIVPID